MFGAEILVPGINAATGDNSPLPPWSGYHQPYSSTEAAAGAALNWAVVLSALTGVEFGGTVYPFGNGFVPSEPVVGTSIGVDIPPRYNGTGDWHSHPVANNPPSNADHDHSSQAQYPGYVGDLSGNMWEVKPGSILDPLSAPGTEHNPYHGPDLRPIPGGLSQYQPGHKPKRPGRK